MRIGMLVLVAIALSGCSTLSHKNLPAPCGVYDYVEVPIGAKISDVNLPTDEAGKKYNIVVQKKGFWISQECDERIGR